MGMLQQMAVLSIQNGVAKIGFLDAIDAEKARRIEEEQHRYFFDLNDDEFEKSVDRAMTLMINKLEKWFLPDGEVTPESFAEMFQNIKIEFEEPETRDNVLREAGDQFISSILARIRRGETVEGDALLDGSGKPGTPGRYTASYEAYKKEIGRSPYTPGDRLRLGATPGPENKKRQERKKKMQFEKQQKKTSIPKRKGGAF